jgi:hypothetical protein
LAFMRLPCRHPQMTEHNGEWPRRREMTRHENDPHGCR